MKSFTLGAALLAGNVAAFPHLSSKRTTWMDDIVAPLKRDPEAMQEAVKKIMAPRQSTEYPQGGDGQVLPLTPPPFNAAAQLVDVSGDYAFVAPTSTDARGECPGLNAMANHGYLPHDGVATITEFIDATYTVFGMGLDLGTFLATYGAIVDGDGTSWSISGGPHVGIGGSHGDYEGDSSPFKEDLFQYGSNENLNLDQFTTFFEMQSDASTANYNLDVLRDFRIARFQQSIDQNPYFAYTAFTGMAVSQAAFTFIYRFMANHSAEYPEGILDQDVLKSFNSITGDYPNFVWTKGYEQIPENWYRRDVTVDSYTIPYFLTDVLYFGAADPSILGIGCNEGTVDSYQAIDITTVTDGAYTAEEAAADPLCFAFEFANAELPGLTGLTTTVLAPLTALLDDAISAMDCSASITTVNMSALTACPGFTLYDGPTASVAPGSIQDN